MKVRRHAEVTLVALTEKMPVPASVILSQLRQMQEPAGSCALEVCRMTMWHGDRVGSNGDSVVVIIREGEVVTAMLRRSWNQPFTTGALRVDEVRSWAA
jgi:hypothetical protein